jgi:hypothetical protein
MEHCLRCQLAGAQLMFFAGVISLYQRVHYGAPEWLEQCHAGIAVGQLWAALMVAQAW